VFSIKRKTTDLTDNDNDNLPTFQKINSLPRNCRLHTSADFTSLIGTEYQLNGNWIQVFAKPNHLRYSRLGLIVSKKIERLAVKRNWIKRLLRETFRNNRYCEKSFWVRMDWVIRLRRPVTKKESLQLTTEIRLLMAQLQQCHD
jgi:ribonuclease P protein component